MCSCSGSCDCNSVTVPRGPQGPIGETGPQGSIGNTGPRGFTGLTGPQGFSGVVSVEAPITNTGTSNFAIIGIDINELITLINTSNTGGGFIPTGAIIAFGGTTAPAGWIICSGGEVSRSGIYAALYAVIGDTYGNGDGTNTFNLPDLKHKVPVGYDFTTAPFDTLGYTDGDVATPLTVANLPLHTHEAGDDGATMSISGGSHNHSYGIPYRAPMGTGSDDNVAFIDSTTVQSYATSSDTHTHPNTEFSGVVGNGAGTFLNTPVTNMQPYLVINYIIKL